MSMQRMETMRRLGSCVQELMGTFILVATVAISGHQNYVCTGIARPLAIGSVLMVLVFMGGHVSGAHYNPAVTLAVFLSGRNKIALMDTVLYMIMQFLGALLAGLYSWGIIGDTLAIEKSTSAGAAIALEALFTFLLVTVVLNTATTKTVEKNSFYGLAIGFTVLAGAAVVGPVTGGVFNPAVSFGTYLPNAMNKGSDSLGTPPYIYYLGPFLGSIVGVVFFRFTNYTREYATHDPLIREESTAESEFAQF